MSICLLAFSVDGMFLSLSSNTETLHIFKVKTVKEKPQGAHHLDWLLREEPGPPECALMRQHRLDGSMETTSEIVDSASHDCPLVTQTYGVAKGAYAPSCPKRLGNGQDANLEAYTDELDAMGSMCQEDKASTLHLDEDSKHTPMILRTD
ncbi:WD repeat domain phosphoinositide-interacting protein 2 [Heterocephalus glaber]|uniref:WD repeat domain phosphoinositide-interacting protein 2 n=1 Tax=Heterocephalus glaber TaxID=10181 RepID=G5AX27_HETGA|nr:WD repeat domain phosphoinositide-interacting protein 2 [Heterocephalus glaber]